MVNNINSILKGFTDKTLSYQEYLSLAGIDDNLGTFIAYTTFTEKPNLTRTDIINYQKEIKKEIKKETFEQFSCLYNPPPKPSLLQDQSDKVKQYCSDNPSDKACVCINNTLIRIAQDEKEDEQDRIKYCNWKTEDDKFEQEYQNRLTDYNKRYGELEKSLKSWRIALVRDFWNNGEPKNLGYTDKSKYVMQMVDSRGTWIWQKFDWDVVYKSSYITEELDRFFRGNHPSIVSARIRKDQPNINPRSSFVQCCNNNIDAPSATLKEIVQSCNQTIILNAEQMEEAKRQEAEEQERKKKEEEELAKKKEEEEAAAIIAAEVASAKKKKIFGIILIVLLVLIVLGISVFMYFNLSKQPIISTTPSSIPSTP